MITLGVCSCGGEIVLAKRVKKFRTHWAPEMEEIIVCRKCRERYTLDEYGKIIDSRKGKGEICG
jgi:hypothetical protein